MNLKALAPLLGVILLAALAYAFWPEVPEPAPPTASVPVLPLRLPAPAATPTPMAVLRLPGDAGPSATELPSVIPSPGLATGPVDPDELELDAEADPEHLRALGVPEDAYEPLDAGALLSSVPKAFKAAVLSQIKDCVPAQAKVKLSFSLAEIPGRARAKVWGVRAGDGGVAFAPIAECVSKRVSGLRFDVPPGGEGRISFPVFDVRRPQ